MFHLAGWLTVHVSRVMLPFKFLTTLRYANVIRIYGYHLLRDDPSIVGVILSSHEKNGLARLFLGLSAGKYWPVMDTEASAVSLEIEVIESEVVKEHAPNLSKWTDVYVTVPAVTRTAAEHIFTDFINSARQHTDIGEDFKVPVQIYDAKQGWRSISNIPNRPMDTIYLDPTVKQHLLQDLNHFVADEEDYAQYGIPYKRCYLFQGTPGSGKTSLIMAIAAMLKKGINFFNFSAEITDLTFISAVSQLSHDKILVLEDIDALFIDRSRTDSHCVSFSALLNVLDGICHKHKMMTFLTSNHTDRLDPALFRPGRVDYIMDFTFVGHHQVKQMYDRLLPTQSEQFDAFYTLIRGKKINMSLIQKFLFEHRKDPNIMEFDEELANLITKHREKDRIGVF